MSKASAKLNFDSHKIRIYHRDRTEFVVRPGHCVVAVPGDYRIFVMKEDQVKPYYTVIQHGATPEKWQAAMEEYERRRNQHDLRVDNVC